MEKNTIKSFGQKKQQIHKKETDNIWKLNEQYCEIKCQDGMDERILLDFWYQIMDVWSDEILFTDLELCRDIYSFTEQIKYRKFEDVYRSAVEIAEYIILTLYKSEQSGFSKITAPLQAAMLKNKPEREGLEDHQYEGLAISVQQEIKAAAMKLIPYQDNEPMLSGLLEDIKQMQLKHERIYAEADFFHSVRTRMKAC